MSHGVRLRPLAALAACLLCAAGTRAAQPDHPVVPGFERFHAAEKADAQGGQLLLGELNCVSCHQADDKAVSRKQAPVLDHVAARVRVSHLKAFLSDPQAVKPGTSMPNVLAGDPEREQKVEALVHFLASTGALKQERFDAKAATNGRDLYHKVGCVACHGTRDASGQADKTLPTSVPLGDLKAKYTIASLAAFLDNPHGVRPSGRMPKLLKDKETKDVANYLLQGIKFAAPQGRGAAAFAYYEGSWDKLPDFDKLQPKETGTGPAFDLAAARRDSNYALKFEGVFKLDQDADYVFTLHSDDGSRLFIDGKLVVDNDGTHPPQAKTGKAKLTKGVHKVTVTFFQGGGGAELEVRIEAPGLGQRDLGDLVAPTEAALEKKPAVNVPKDEDSIDIRPELVEKGKAVFASNGCANCHQLNSGGKAVASSLTPPALGKLRPEGGCLSASPVKGTPWFGLSAAQRGSLAAAIKTPPAAPEPKEVIARTMTTFNCYACHVRDKVGGPEEALNAAFQTTQPEMGDEGRVPPPLDGVGAKLNPEYMKSILDKGAHDRPYMHTRMPGFGDANVGHLVKEFGTTDTLPAAPAVTFAESMPRVKASARHLVGGQAFGCVKCHTFNGVKAEGVQGIDMTLMPRRLKHDWFLAYVENPAAFRPGTRMPSAFFQGKSVLPEILDGRPATQIEAIWLYLSDGKPQLPVGMGKKSIPLVPEKSAILYRNFIEGAGPRAVGVGYPEKAHLAFDANEMRLALLWQGAFMDAGRHWTDRGEGYEGPLGDNILHLPAGVSFAVLPTGDAPWPALPAKAQGYRFLGYNLSDDDRPTFLYAAGNVKVEDFPNAVAGKDPSVRRTLRLTASGPADNLFFRAAVGAKVEALGDGWYRVDGTYKVKVESAGAPVLRQSGGKTELLVPVRFAGGKAQVVQEIVW
jgi:mono/diheme cytochrome c family protein